jgi:hypothetical protein
VHRGEQRQLPTGRVAGDCDAIAVHAEVGCTIMDERERRVVIVDLGRPRGFVGQAVLARDTRVSGTSERDGVAT